MENKPNQKAKELNKEEKNKRANKTKIVNLSSDDIKGITGGQRCGGVGK